MSINNMAITLTMITHQLEHDVLVFVSVMLLGLYTKLELPGEVEKFDGNWTVVTLRSNTHQLKNRQHRFLHDVPKGSNTFTNKISI